MDVEFCEDNSRRSKKMRYFRKIKGGGGGGGRSSGPSSGSATRLKLNLHGIFLETLKCSFHGIRVWRSLSPLTSCD